MQTKKLDTCLWNRHWK